jgi:hypothetical protein
LYALLVVTADGIYTYHCYLKVSIVYDLSVINKIQVAVGRLLTLTIGAVPWLRSLVAELSPWTPGFAPGSIHVGFAVDKVALG